jgi:D-ornithine 4,5-aminomutase subunit alpha
MERKDDYLERRKHLADLSNQELKDRFWELAFKLTEPMAELAKDHTSPSIERSVLLRMGFNSIECKEIVQKILEAGLLPKGAGHVVLKLSKKLGISIEEAGQAIIKGEPLTALFSGVNND